MKTVIIILILIVCVWFILQKIDVVHISGLKQKEKDEIENKEKIRSMLIYNHIKKIDNEKENDSIVNEKTYNNEPFTNLNPNLNYSGSKINSRSKKDVNFLSPKKMLDMINEDYIYHQYKFNLTTSPVTVRYPKQNRLKCDKKYKKIIKKNIEKLVKNLLEDTYDNDINDIKKYFSVKKINLVMVEQTENEAMITANISTVYLDKTLHLQLTYWCKIERPDSFDADSKYYLQLVKIKPIDKNNFDPDIQFDNGPFMSMAKQMEYVNKIDNMHQMEADGYFYPVDSEWYDN